MLLFRNALSIDWRAVVCRSVIGPLKMSQCTQLQLMGATVELMIRACCSIRPSCTCQCIHITASANAAAGSGVQTRLEQSISSSSSRFSWHIGIPKGLIVNSGRRLAELESTGFLSKYFKQ